MDNKQIEIDLDVYKALESLRESFTETHNDILRRSILPLARPFDIRDQTKGGLYIRDGVTLGEGTRLRHIAKRRGEQYEAIIRDSGIEYKGKRYHSPSKAAIAATNTNRNGWTFWEYFDINLQQWCLLNKLREEN